MFRKRDPQNSLFQTSSLIPRSKAKRLEKSWAEAFRSEALPLIDEELFASMYCNDNGRPNTPVQIVFGTLLLKEMFDLTDEGALEQLEYNLQWQYALRLTPEEAHLCQKTLHNFRVRMMEHNLSRLVFQETTDRIIEALGVKVGRQRLDSTHIVSNVAKRTRLGLFCETIRVFLLKLKNDHPRFFKRISVGLCRRYLKKDGSSTSYGDVPSDRVRRRISVCARDLYRLISRFRKTSVENLDEYGLLQRLFEEQCESSIEKDRPSEDDDDFGEGGAPIRLKEPKEVSSESLQTPHDPDVTYNGHKGKGYEVQVAETCEEENEVQIITDVEVTDSCDGDSCATIPIIEGLKERGIQPEELTADTVYGSGENAVEAERLGTKLISPVGGKVTKEDDLSDENRPLTAADFSIDPSYQRPTVCPGGQKSIEETEEEESSNKVEIHFEKETCEACPLFSRCPAKLNFAKNVYVLKANLVKVNIEQRRRFEATEEFSSRYDIRAGIEATNSEMKRKQGLGRLRVRKRPRVALVVFLKTMACNFKRMVRSLISPEPEMIPVEG
jgi:hypothetical protein